MRLCRANQKTDAVSTDFVGFRISRFLGQELTFTEYRNCVAPSVLLGNSAAFGVGASHDEHALASQLGRSTGHPWFNLSGRASNMMQDVLTLMLFGAAKHQNIVLMSGANDLLFSLYFKQTYKNLPVFWSDDQFDSLNDADDKLETSNCDEISSDERYQRALDGIGRALLLLARYGANDRARVLFVLQPLLVWTDKPLHMNEKNMSAEWDAITAGFRVTHKPEVVLPWKHRFAEDIHRLCEENGLDFLDLNTHSAMLTGEHLFADRIHLTDRGQELVAKLIAERLS